MAAPIMCNGPDGGPAVVMVTMLADGDTVGLCNACLVDWSHALIKATAPDLLADQPARPARKPRAKRTTAPLAGTKDASVSGQGIHLVSLDVQADGSDATD